MSDDAKLMKLPVKLSDMEIRERAHEAAEMYSRPMTDAEKRMAAQATLWDGEPAAMKTTVGAT